MADGGWSDGAPTADTPPLGKPGWYWDPHELEFNLALRERWRRDWFVTSQDNQYRLRRWDGQNWTDETLRRNYTPNRGRLPYRVGPTTRIPALTPAQTRARLKIWAMLMVVGIVVAILFGHAN